MADNAEPSPTSTSGPQSGETRPPQPSRPTLNYEALSQHVVRHKVDCALWAIRIVTLMFTFSYFIPIFTTSQNAYYKALLANAAINALRLHQRLGRVEFTRQFLAGLLMEDSFHYLFYSMIFLYVAPITLALIPIVLFALLHAASYSLTLLDTLGQNAWWGARLLISLVEFQSLNILRLVAFVEIVLMPFAVLLTFSGHASFLTPFIYYQFITQRYTSRRNPYNRNMFYELRLLCERTAANPRVPHIVKNLILGVVNFTVKLAPVPQINPPTGGATATADQHQQ